MTTTKCKFIVRSDHKYAYEVDRHYHDCFEIVYYEKGHGTTIIDGKEYKFGPNTFAIIPPKIVHSETANIDVVKLIFMGFEIEDNTILKSGLFINDTTKTSVLSCLKKIFKEVNHKSFDYQN